jgi:hypothetical protein
MTPVLKYVGDILKSQDGMIASMTAKRIEDSFTKNLSDFNPKNIDTFGNLFTTDIDYKKHIEKRLEMGHIVDDVDYALKTFTALSVANRSVFETYPQKTIGVWDRILYDSEHKWVVILGENGKILTSYQMDGDFDDLIQKHKEQHGAKVLERKQSENLRTTSKQLRDRVKILYGR